MQLKGANGTITTFDDRLEISRKTRATKTLRYEDIKAVEVLNPTMMIKGYIEFIIKDNPLVTRSVGFVSNRAANPYAVIFNGKNRRHLDEIEAMKNFLQSKI